jgi:hypothetical protein
MRRLKKVINILPWSFLVIFVWMYGQDLKEQLTGNENWYEVQSVTVMDAHEGDVPRMEVTRFVNKPFVAEWVATVRQLTKDGLETTCVGSGKSQYIPESKTPKDLDLDWWLGKECPLKPGRYKVDTLWTLDVPGYRGPREVMSRSNIFTVTPRT